MKIEKRVKIQQNIIEDLKAENKKLKEELNLVKLDLEFEKTFKDEEYDVLVGPESRGFIFGVTLAYLNHKSFVPVRKKGKLPCETIEEEYALEYGTAIIEMHKDAIKPGQKVVIVDDLMATGGTLKAICNMIERLGGKVEKIVVLMELLGLNGRKVVEDYKFDSVIKYPGK